MGIDTIMSTAIETIIVLVIGVIILAVATAGGCIERALEKREWNRGYCQRHAAPWICYDTDSQGGRMYHCHHGCNVDISCSVDTHLTEQPLRR